VRAVRLSGSKDPNRVVEILFSVELEHLCEIPNDSTAQVSAENIIGDQFLDISKGVSPQRVSPGGEIAYKADPELLKSLDIPQFEKNLRAIDAMIADIQQGRGPVGEFVVGDRMYEDLRRRVRELQRGIQSATNAGTQIGKLLYTESDYRRLLEPVRRLDDSLARIQSGQGEAGRLLRDAGQYEQVRATLENLHRTLAAQKLTDETQYRQWNARVSSLIAWVEELNVRPAFSRTEVYDGLNGAARELGGTLREFREDPRKFLRVKVF
jgi:phospholipid/cholesterol/gamma-HCH transport system substrate-binding protein